MSEDGPKGDEIVATPFQGLTPMDAPCLRFGLCNAQATFTRLMTRVWTRSYICSFKFTWMTFVSILKLHKNILTIFGKY